LAAANRIVASVVELNQIIFFRGESLVGAFNALRLLVGRQEGHPACKN